jgi:hypothetical protein
MVRVEEVNYLECKRLGAVVACGPEGDRQGDSSKGDGLHAQDHSVKWVWAALEVVLGESQSHQCVEVHEVEAIAPIHKGLSEPGCPDQRVEDEGKPPWLGDAIRVVHPIKSDRGFRPVHFGAAVLTEMITRPVSLSLQHDSWGAGPCKST